MDCECKADSSGFYFCSLHEAAPKMLEALKGVAFMQHAGLLKQFEGEPWLRRVHEAIAELEKEVSK